MFFTEDDLRSIIEWARWRTCVSLGIAVDDDIFSLPDALETISALKGHKDALDEFSAAYQEWFKFHLDIFKANRSGQLSSVETATLDRLKLRRDTAKKALIDITPM